MKLYLFDVDGVLCDTGCKINKQFHDYFVEWSKDKPYALITGGKRQSTINQIGENIVNNAFMSLHSMGNHIFIQSREYKINQFTFYSPEQQWLEDFVKNSQFHIKLGNYFDIRTGSVNFSLIGQNATLDQKKEYAIYDKHHNERINLIIKFKKQFPKYNAYIGGNASIDICLKGADKSQCLPYLGSIFNKIIFFGDRGESRYEIDYPIFEMIQGVKITNGYNETWNILKKI